MVGSGKTFQTDAYVLPVVAYDMILGWTGSINLVP